MAALVEGGTKSGEWREEGERSLQLSSPLASSHRRARAAVWRVNAAIGAGLAMLVLCRTVIGRSRCQLSQAFCGLFAPVSYLDSICISTTLGSSVGTRTMAHLHGHLPLSILDSSPRRADLPNCKQRVTGGGHTVPKCPPPPPHVSHRLGQNVAR